MVRFIGVLLLTLASWWGSESSFDPDIRVNAQIESTSAFEGNPLTGTITVTHKLSQPVDTASFHLEDQSLKVDQVKEVRMSPTDSLVITIYHFQLPARVPGSYTLSPVSVMIDGQSYQSLPMTFEVVGAAAASLQTPNTAQLLLQAVRGGPSPLYPGQLTKFVYRYIFRGDIQLVTETLPLLDAKGFIKVGEKEITSYREGDVSVQQIVQAVRAVSAGDFTFPASVIEGYAYQENVVGKRVMLQPKLHAATPPLKVVVMPFPAADKPATFNGAVGQFALQVSLLSSSHVTVDDRLSLAVEISGEDLATVAMPNLAQSGFQPLFRLSDLPAVGKIEGKTKRFEVDIYPLSSELKEIPAIIFSYFDPSTVRYVTLKSAPIPITVKARTQVTTAPLQPQVVTPPPLEHLAHQPVTVADLKPLSFGTWTALWVIPVGILLLVAQLLLQQMRVEKQSKESRR